MTTAVREARFATLPRLAAGFKPSIPIRARYDNWIGGEYAAPFRGQYFVNPTPITMLSADGQVVTEISPGDELTFRRSQRTVRLMHLENSSFFETLRVKLHWRGANL